MLMATTPIADDARKVRFLDWLTTPPHERDPQTQTALAEELGVSTRLLRLWKADPAFRAAWDKQAKDIIGDPEKIQRLLEDIYEGARDRNETLASRVRAADLYIRSVEGIRPPQVDMARKKAAELSDAELDALIAEAAQAEKVSRGG